MSAKWKQEGAGRNQWGGSVTVISMQCFFLAAKLNRRGGSERECWGGSVTVTSISLCVFFCQPSISIRLCVFCQPSGSRRGPGRECWGGSVTVISIRLCVLSAKWKQEGVREEIMGWECNCY